MFINASKVSIKALTFSNANVVGSFINESLAKIIHSVRSWDETKGQEVVSLNPGIRH